MEEEKIVDQIGIQLKLSKKANSLVAYEKARRGIKTKAETINLLLEKLEEDLR